jgi:hypothetical protein
MSEYLFGLHRGHLTAKADKIAREHGANHVNYTEPRGEKRGWYSGPNRGEPFDGDLSRRVLEAVDAAGGCRRRR